MTLYVLDTSAFVEAWHRFYPPDRFPTLWESIDGLALAGELVAPDEVVTELKSYDDDLHRWVKERGNRVVAATTRPVMEEVRAILADDPLLVPTGPGAGRSAAEPFVVAVAADRSGVVVTQEPGVLAACHRRGIPGIDLAGLIDRQGWTVPG